MRRHTAGPAAGRAAPPGARLPRVVEPFRSWARWSDEAARSGLRAHEVPITLRLDADAKVANLPIRVNATLLGGPNMHRAENSADISVPGPQALILRLSIFLAPTYPQVVPSRAHWRAAYAMDAGRMKPEGAISGGDTD